MDKDYREKIRKLLALAESPNENEAAAALLKARELMIEHKVTELDLKENTSKKVIKAESGITYSKHRNPWVNWLSVIIAENYCCKAASRNKIGSSVNDVVFFGLEEDAEICLEIFRYAVDCVLSKAREIRREAKKTYNGDYAKRISESYGFGFSAGLLGKYRKQDEEKQEEEGWALVAQIPKEVADATGSIKEDRRSYAKTERLTVDEWRAGYVDGRNFSPEERLEE